SSVAPCAPRPPLFPYTTLFRSPPPRILMLTTFDIDDYVHDALQAGASGFLLKDATPEELVHAVRVVAAGDALLSPGITRRMIAQFAARRPRPPRDSALLARLTDREREAMLLIPAFGR